MNPRIRKAASLVALAALLLPALASMPGLTHAQIGET